MNIPEKWKTFVNSLNSNGIPVPMLRSPDTGKASVSLTLVFISFNLVIIGLMGKYSRMLEGVDVSQAISLFSICAALYWGRKFQKDPKGNVTVEDAPKDENKP